MPPRPYRRFITRPVVRRMVAPLQAWVERKKLTAPLYHRLMGWFDRLCANRWVQQRFFAQEVQLIRDFAQDIGLPPASFPDIIHASLRARCWREYLCTGFFFGSAAIWKTIAHVHGTEHAVTAHARGKGTLFIALHYLTGSIALLRQPLAGLPTPIEHFIAQNTQRADRAGPPEANAVGRGQDLLHALTVLRRNGAVGILLDGGRGQQAVTLPILGRATEIRPSFAHLALLSGAAVIPMHSQLDEQGYIQLHLHPPLQDDTAQSDTQRLDALLEQAAAFWERTCLAYPVSIQYFVMRGHLQRPRWEAEPRPGEPLAPR